MADFITIKEIAEKWGISERRVSTLCRDGRIEGAKKSGRAWLVPVDAKKPVDNRVNSGVYIREQKVERLPLPIGISDYRLAASEYYYIDKTMMIKDFIDDKTFVSLFTRPRRFGKSLNMDMLRTFFEKTNEDTSVYFKDKKIWNCGQKYRDYQGKYPVIFISFKDVKFYTWEDTFWAIRDVIAKETYRHMEIATSDKCTDYEKDMFRKLTAGELSEVELSSALANMSQMLHTHHGVAPIIIIDEYDIPIQQGYMQGFYEEVVLFMRNLFSGGLKDNKHISYGFLTGILRVAKESIFSGLNNLVIYSVLDDKYSSYFGFTEGEVREMTKHYGVEDKYDEICEWYDGYKFGDTEIFNPWSVINYFNNGCRPRTFWQASGSNDIIGEIIKDADREIYERLTAFVSGAKITTYIDTNVIYPQIKRNPATIYSFLLMAGYLKVEKTMPSFNGDFMCEVALPNKEITHVYNKEILEQLEDIIPQYAVVYIQEALYTGNCERLQKYLHNMLKESASYYDTLGENFYHGFMLGMCAMFGEVYVTSNRESGDGRYDIQLMPKKENLPGILIELKYAKDVGNDELKQLADAALKQITERKYDTEMVAKGVKQIYKYGVAFCGKNVEISVEI